MNAVNEIILDQKQMNAALAFWLNSQVLQDTVVVASVAAVDMGNAFQVVLEAPPVEDE